MRAIEASTAERSTELIEALGGHDRYLVVTHDNPDPDAIAAGWAIHLLISERLGKPVRLVAGGAIVRAENRYMVELLRPPLELVDEVEWEAGTGAVLVDCDRASSNHLLADEQNEPTAVIDHHLHSAAGDDGTLFRDIRPEAAASASIAASYLREQRIEPGVKLASSILYAIRTETRGCEIGYSPLDRAVISWLTDAADPALIAAIENAPLAPEYFGDLVLALQSTFVYEDAAFCLLPRAQGAEIVGEVADLLVRCETIDRVLCGAVVGDDLILSVRTVAEAGNAASLVAATLEGLGWGGGHARRAGGKVTGIGRGVKLGDELANELRGRWLAACGIERQRGVRLVSKREIVSNL